jgi:hypothetical protein
LHLHVGGVAGLQLDLRLTGSGFVDSIGAAGRIYFSYNEGQESFEKAADLEACCDDEE